MLLTEFNEEAFARDMWEEGMEKGKIYAAVSMCRSLGLQDDNILQKLQELFHLDRKDALVYLQEVNVMNG